MSSSQLIEQQTAPPAAQGRLADYKGVRAQGATPTTNLVLYHNSPSSLAQQTLETSTMAAYLHKPELLKRYLDLDQGGKIQAECTLSLSRIFRLHMNMRLTCSNRRLDRW